MITKSKGSNRYVNYRETNPDGRQTTSYTYGSFSDTITYQQGPAKIDGRSNWKQCYHSWVKAPDLLRWSGLIWGKNYSYEWAARAATPAASAVPSLDSLPSLKDLMANFYDQVDLNCSDAVLLYSGILQAVPLVGGALKGVSLLNNAARKLSRSFRKQPFTTVVKSLISADFIDRFVVSPTIDDMRKFADATDYVVRVMNTAATRNAELATAFESKLTNVTKRSSTTWSGNQGASSWQIRTDNESTASGTLKVLAKVTYDQSAISPIKLWAARVGLTRPLDSVWDLVPFSFVIDYFTRAGDFISHVSDSMSDQAGLRGSVGHVYGAWLMTKCEAICTSHVLRWTPQSHMTPLGRPGEKVSASAGNFSRREISLLSEPSFWDGGGFVSPSLSTTRLRTLLELIIQAKA